jgi:predicted DNA-binding WGR domain protein
MRVVATHDSVMDPLQFSARRELELRHIDPRRNRARRYHLSKCRSLFGELSILITWGRIGARPRLRLETFRNEATRSARWHGLLARRSSHGYQVVVEARPSLAAVA